MADILNVRFIMSKEDATLVHKAQKDGSKFAALYEKYAKKIYNYFLYRLGGDRVLAEDLTQETFTKAFAHLSRFEVRNYSYLTYLMTIAHNLLVNQYRKPRSAPIDAAGDMPVEIANDIEKRSDIETIRRAIADLAPREREVMRLRYQLGLSIRDIAGKEGVSENAIKLLLSRARKKLLRHRFVRGY